MQALKNQNNAGFFEMLECLDLLRKAALEHLQEVETRTDIPDCARGVFRAINNKTELCYRIFHAHFNPGTFANNDELMEMLQLLLKDFLFVPTMSAVEYCFLTLPYDDVKTPITKKQLESMERQNKSIRDVNFSKLVKWLAQDRLIDNPDLWDFAIGIRNDFVHFNAHARDDRTCPKKELKIFVLKGNAIAGEPRSIVQMVAYLEASCFALFRQWVRVKV